MGPPIPRRVEHYYVEVQCPSNQQAEESFAMQAFLFGIISFFMNFLKMDSSYIINAASPGILPGISGGIGSGETIDSVITLPAGMRLSGGAQYEV